MGKPPSHIRLPRLAAVFAVLSVAANVSAFGIGTRRGLLPPDAFDFGSMSDLTRLSSESAAHILPVALSLLSPCLAIPVGLGWFHVLKSAGWLAVFGITMFYVGMVFVVILDIVELVAIAALAPAYGHATDASGPALVAVGAVLQLGRRVVGYVGHFFAFGLGQLALGLAVLRVPNVPSWLGWLSFVPAILLGWVATLVELAGIDVAAGPSVAVGVLSFLLWVLSMTVVLARWDPRDEGASARDARTG